MSYAIHIAEAGMAGERFCRHAGGIGDRRAVAGEQVAIYLRPTAAQIGSEDGCPRRDAVVGGRRLHYGHRRRQRVRDHRLCARRLGSYKKPSRVIFTTEPLPKSVVGKLQRKKLREPYWQGHERRVGGE